MLALIFMSCFRPINESCTSLLEFAKVNYMEFDTLIDPRTVIKRPHTMSIGSNCAIDAGYYFTIKAEIGP